LPTEAEWEYACRAGTTTRYYNGDDDEALAQVGNVSDGIARKRYPSWRFTIGAEDGYGATAPVGKFRANGFGLHDMHGNVWEWCADWSGAYSGASQTDPTGPPAGLCRMVRGGGFGSVSRCRSAHRAPNRPPAEPKTDLGFRVARAAVAAGTP
jgi:formylglycine-generating enzyme required for sulfatase activity